MTEIVGTTLGSFEGLSLAKTVGWADGFTEGTLDIVGGCVGAFDQVGNGVGYGVGSIESVGATDGKLEGAQERNMLNRKLGNGTVSRKE